MLPVQSDGAVYLTPQLCIVTVQHDFIREQTVKFLMEF